MAEILASTGAKLWGKDDYGELWLSVFAELTGTSGKSNIRLIDEAIGRLNTALNGYYLLYENDRLYICKDTETATQKLPVSLVDNNGNIASGVDGTTITIDENGVLSATSKITVDDAFSDTSENPLQNKVIKAKLDEITGLLESNETAISSNTSAIGVLNGEGAGSVKKTAMDIVSGEVAKIVSGAPESLDTLKEISDWIGGHENDASAMNTAIKKNTQDIADHAGDSGVHVTSAEKSLVGKLGESENGTLTYNGEEIRAATDTALSTTSENAVQNKVVTIEINSINEQIHNLKPDVEVELATDITE